MKKKKEDKKEYQKPNVKVLIQGLSEKYGLNFEEVVEYMKLQYPEFFVKETCGNCGGSMVIYTYTLDCLDSLLVYGMAKIVRKRVSEGIPFTQANKIHVQKELNKYYSVASRTTQCSKLGLITKSLNKDGTHNQAEGWCVTARGFKFIAGEPVVKMVTVFQNKIVKRHEETIVIEDAFKEHTDLILSKIERKKKIGSDYSPEISTYKKNEWYGIYDYKEQWPEQE